MLLMTPAVMAADRSAIFYFVFRLKRIWSKGKVGWGKIALIVVMFFFFWNEEKDVASFFCYEITGKILWESWKGYSVNFIRFSFYLKKYIHGKFPGKGRQILSPFQDNSGVYYDNPRPFSLFLVWLLLLLFVADQKLVTIEFERSIRSESAYGKRSWGKRV